MILVDTSVWIDFLHGTDSIFRQKLHDLIVHEKEICLTEIIITEILQGIKDDKAYNEIKRYLLQFPLFSANGINNYIEAANIFRKCRKRGITVRKTIDCIIAAIVLENRLTLFHNDNDFNYIAQCYNLKMLKL